MIDLPSVTQILSPWQSFAGVRPDVLERACARGTYVHSACAGIAEGLWGVVNPLYLGWIDSFRGWFDKAVDDVLAVEPELTSKIFGFKGRPDLIVRLKGDKHPSLCDLKTPKAKNPAWRLQLAGYKQLAEEKKYRVKRIFSLRLKENGNPPTLDEYTNEYTRNVEDIQTFLACLTAWKYFHQKEGTHERL